MLLGALVLLSGCDGAYNQTFTGEDVWKMFPFDGQRDWVYLSTDHSSPYKLHASCDGKAEVIGGKNVYTVKYAKTCVALSDTCVDDELLYQLRWSSDAIDGTFIHAFAVGDDTFTDLKPPMQFTSDTEKRDDAYTTETGGWTFTSTMGPTEACPIAMGVEWDECAHWIVTVDTGDGFPIAGDWWTVSGNGVAAFQLGPDTGQWQLSDFDCQPDEDCDGTW
jgi:hypothetical protein